MTTEAAAEASSVSSAPGASAAPAPDVEVVAAGAASLLGELVMLRFLPGQNRVLGYFTNFVLLAAFVGLGVGMLAHRRTRTERLSWLALPALALLIALAALSRRIAVMGSTGEVLFLEYESEVTRFPLFPFLAVAYVTIALAFVPVGHWVGSTLAGALPLRRYALNVAGSLAGIAAFAVLSALAVPPWAATALAAGALALALARASGRWRAIGLLAAVVAVALTARATAGATWSPYQKITTAPARLLPERGLVQEWHVPSLTPAQRERLVVLAPDEGFTVRVNDDSYQTPLDLRDAAIERHPALRPLRIQYDLPYTVRPPGRVLVLGAGTGNDVAAALRCGATHVDAVEIDPEILALGRRHPEHPYEDARVTTHVTDARSFLARDGGASYDTVVYGLLDSHVLLSSMSNVRLDSYVFTEESFALARKRLAPKGLLVVSHAVGTPWFVTRMRATLAKVFGRPPLLAHERVKHPIGFVYVAGDDVASGVTPMFPAEDLLRDDWPFVYLEQAAIPKEYLVAMALMAVASLALVRAGAGKRFAEFDVHFFALGAGFLLLETRGLAVLALVAGSTWSVTSSVFAGVLVMALAATLIASRLGGAAASPRSVSLAYVVLLGALGLQFAIGAGDLAPLPAALRVLLGAALVSLPMLASGVVFSTSLARVGSADRALASNLLGAVAGGLLEYLSMILGFRLLVAVAAVAYGVAFLAWQRSLRRAA